MKDHSVDFADQLGCYLTRAGLTQQELANKVGVHRNTIVKWINRTSKPEFRGLVLQVADELSLSKQERKVLTQSAGFSLERWPTEVWTVPQQPDMFFTGRDTIFQSLRQLLTGDTKTLTQAISGLGGIGKTHTAIEYAYRFHQYYEAVLWMQADSWEVLTSECRKLTSVLGLPEQKEMDEIIAGVQSWLQKHSHWLLILDNVENPQEILSRFVPTNQKGSVLVTTRILNIEPLAQTHILSTMPESEAVLFLLRRTMRIASKAGLEKASLEQYNEAQKIWQLMDGLPLALDQAGAYILETNCSFLDYQKKYEHQRAKLLERRGKRFISHEMSVATTLSLALEQVANFNSMADEILLVCSFLHNETIPEELFSEGADYFGSCLTETENWDEAIGVLQDYSLVQRCGVTRTLTVHRLVQVMLLDSMVDLERDQWMRRTIVALNIVFPEVTYPNWKQCERLLLHAMICIREASATDACVELASLAEKLAHYLFENARYGEAKSLCEQALHIWEQVRGSTHPEIAHFLHNLAIIYEKQGKYEDAESAYKRALCIWEKTRGSEHLDVSFALMNLANLYVAQMKYTEAEQLYKRVLQIREQTLEPRHIQITHPLHGLANLYQLQKKYKDAEKIYEQVLNICEQVLGPEHPDLAPPLNNLARLYFEQEKYGQAESLYERAWLILEETLGPKHPDVALSFHSLGHLYARQGKYEQAESLYKTSWLILEETLGPEHPHTIAIQKTYAAFLQMMG